MNSNFIKSVYAIASLLMLSEVHAEQAIQKLPRYVVSSMPELNIRSTANNQSFISHDELEGMKSSDVNAVLYTSPSVMVAQNKASGFSRVSLRGASGGQGLVTLDGVPLFANFSGLYSMRHFSREMVESIQIQRGFDQNISNSRTLGGAIHLQSRRVDDDKTHFFVEGGSQATVNSSLATGLGQDDENVSLVFGYTHIADGDTQSGTPSPNADSDNYKMGRVLLRGDKTFEKGSLQASFYYVNAQEETDGPGFTPDFKVGWIEDPNGWFSDEVIVSQITGVYDINQNWQSRLQLAYTRDRQDGELGTFRPILPRGPFSMNVTSELGLLDWQNQHVIPLSDNDLNANIGWGMQVQYQNAETTQADRRESELLLSPNLMFSIADNKWRVQLKTQWDHYQDYGAHLTYDLGVEWYVAPELSLWANTGTHYRAPSVNEHLHPLFGNTKLKPEQNFGGEIGANWHINTSTQVELSAYWQEFNEMIVLALNTGTGAIQSGNVAEAQVSGIDLSVKHQWLDNWQSEVNYSFMHSINQQTKKELAGRPSHRFSFINDWEIIDPVHFKVIFNVHDGLWHDTDNALGSGSVIRLHTVLNYQVIESTQLYFRADNLTNDSNSELSGFNYPRRSFYGGVKISF